MYRYEDRFEYLISLLFQFVYDLNSVQNCDRLLLIQLESGNSQFALGGTSEQFQQKTTRSKSKIAAETKELLQISASFVHDYSLRFTN